MKKKPIRYTVRVTTGTGNRVSRGRYNTKAEAQKAISQLNSRTDADTKNPRIKKFKGAF